jgi:predicted anti-sigma-YlaC factor YlaD
MNCSRATGLMSSVLDGEATREEQQMLHFHLSGCARCRKAMAMSRDLQSVLRQISRPEPPQDLEAKIRRRLAAEPVEKIHRPVRWHRLAIAIPFVAAVMIVIGIAAGTGHQPAPAVRQAADKVIFAAEGSLKYTVTTAPLAAYARPASLISF